MALWLWRPLAIVAPGYRPLAMAGHNQIYRGWVGRLEDRHNRTTEMDKTRRTARQTDKLTARPASDVGADGLLVISLDTGQTICEFMFR